MIIRLLYKDYLLPVPLILGSMLCAIVVITRREFEKAMLPLIERMEQAIVGTLEEAVRQDAKRGTALEV
jgi:uncharacterized membrane protein AbrB (regulator of aidB expression)